MVDRRQKCLERFGQIVPSSIYQLPSTTGMSTKTVAIVGASGYSGEELVRLLLSHPQAELKVVTSRQYAGRILAQVFPRFAHHPRARTLRFSEPEAGLLAKQAEVIFLALPHGVAAKFAAPLFQLGCRIIDLSADFRLKSLDRKSTRLNS